VRIGSSRPRSTRRRRRLHVSARARLRVWAVGPSNGLQGQRTTGERRRDRAQPEGSFSAAADRSKGDAMSVISFPRRIETRPSRPQARQSCARGFGAVTSLRCGRTHRHRENRRSSCPQRSWSRSRAACSSRTARWRYTSCRASCCKTSRPTRSRSARSRKVGAQPHCVPSRSPSLGRASHGDASPFHVA